MIKIRKSWKNKKVIIITSIRITKKIIGYISRTNDKKGTTRSEQCKIIK